MEHDIFVDGNVKEYSWSIKTNDKVADQIREHPPAFRSGGKLDIKNNEESRFVALHVGIYWGLGVNIIKDNDVVNVMCDSKIMFEINHSIIDPPKSQNLNDTSQILDNGGIDYLLLIVIGIIAVAIVSVLVVLKQKSKIPQKN